MLRLTAALDARLGQRLTAAVIAVALQPVFYSLIVHDSSELVAVRRSTPFEMMIFEQPRRARPSALPRHRSWRAPTRKAVLRSEGRSSPAGQPINPSPATERAARNPIDWQQAMQREIQEQAFRPPVSQVQFGFPQMPKPVASTPQFGWDYARTHRLEPLPDGGTVINLTDRCALVFYVVLIPVCKIGHIAVDGHLFDNVRDRRSGQEDALP